MVFVGEYWGITVSGLKMGNNSQWAEKVFLLETENGYKRESHCHCTQNANTDIDNTKKYGR